jgi:serine/threonine-protein kinase
MSPEQIRSDAIDTRTDIYSLSVTLFEMLTGHLPFTGASDFDLMSAHLQTPPPPLSRFCPDLAGPLEEAVLKGLTKNPATRFQSAEEFGAALDRIEGQGQRGVPAVVSVQPPPHASPARRIANEPAPAPQRPPARAFVSPQRVSPLAVSPTPPGAMTTRSRRAYYRAFVSLTLGVLLLALLAYEGLRLENVGLLLACAVLLYFFPILIAAISLKRNGPAVVRLNALRGWTGIGWIEAMRQALEADD